MLRQLLTILAVITGLAASAAPAHAQVERVQNVHLQSEAAPEQIVALPAQAGTSRAARLRKPVQLPAFGIAPDFAIASAVAVRIRIDRAHE
ncbi:hypothetical protein [Altericroceibacterium endophyticum]|uniref:Uncharacterized protein n=1 Tax=Altericroceibacterium endophyticum TaxID=1808508 RepID=A0A6I4T1B8_9SPHN|nr:hypothetical protein [Altericroceibacterium endophyticum]MXO64726.1 hypothetical protein [Altericroceibacterium endophyticum]